MNYELDDPRLTAYALGELDDTEKAEVEAFLNENGAAHDEVARIREAAQWLSAELGAETPEGLSELEQARILDRAKTAKPVRRVRWGRWAIAAAVPMILGFMVFTVGPRMIKRAGAPVSPFTYSMGGSEKASQGNLRQLAQSQPTSYLRLTRGATKGDGGSVSANAPKVEVHDLKLSMPAPKDINGNGAPALVAAPVQASQGNYAWDTVRTKTMSQQALDGDSLCAQAPATPNVPVLGAAPATPPAEVKEQLQALGYINKNAPAAAQPAPGMPKPAEATQNVQAFIQLPPPPPPTPVPNDESYPVLPENTFQRVADAPLSTFGLDVDTAAYANVRRFLSQGTLPPGEAVRIEELINYFKYDYPKPEGDAPFSVTVDAHPCPWAPTHTLARIGVRGKELNTETRPPANLVFLIDVSGSMADADKLPLLKKGMKLLAQTVTANDRVSIVTYASGVGVALYPTPGDNKAAIEGVIDTLNAGGSTNGAGGIQLAYDLARRAFIQNGVNRVILATDGDFNVGISDTGTLVNMIQEQAKTGVALSVLGFGQGNLKDERMMKLADKGNGNYAYIDSFQEARKVLLEQAAGTLFTIAKDVKIQIEFNPGRVGAYRLIGYEKRMLAAQDFNDDRKDAGEIGAGHTVTALYELVPPGEAIAPPQTDPLKYQAGPAPAPAPAASDSPEMMTVKLRFKPPTGDVSTRFDVPIPATVVTAETRPDFQFASAVAAFGMLLRHSAYAGTATMDMVINLAQQGKGADENGLRAEFTNLARTASALLGTPRPVQQ